ncbi:MAG: phosphatidylserine decarboxylase [Thermodesulfobacteriaceae bacterium]|nr:phosphatidylserine decarboxylase [Thermodesulfobacteriaceae bacterium]
MIHKEGKNWVLAPLLFSLGSLFLGRKKLALLGFTLGAFNAYFFRNPKREGILNPEIILSPADGKVVTCELEERPEWYSGYLWRVGIFMRLWDVHINRAPITSKVLKIHYLKGEKNPIFKEKAFVKNEKQIYLLEREDGVPFWLIQVAGVIARRIKSFVLPGEDLIAGEPIGIIKFGSRVELFFPAEGTEIYVKKGHKVLAGETVIGKISLRK